MTSHLVPVKLPGTKRSFSTDRSKSLCVQTRKFPFPPFFRFHFHFLFSFSFFFLFHNTVITVKKSHHNHKNIFPHQSSQSQEYLLQSKNTSHNNKFQKNTSHNHKFHIIQAEQAAPHAAGRPAWPPRAAGLCAPPRGRPGPRAPPGGLGPARRRESGLAMRAAGMPPAACLRRGGREREREDERTEWRGRRSGEERMRMRLGLVSGGVDILRTTEDFFGWHG